MSVEGYGGVRDHQLDATQAAAEQASEEIGPEGGGFRGADMPAHDLALAIGVGGHGDYGRDTDDAPALALLEVSGIEPKIGPFAFERAVEEAVHPFVDVLAEFADGAFGDAAQADGLDQILDAAG